MNLDNTEFLKYFDLPPLPDDIFDYFMDIGAQTYQYLLETNFQDKQIIDKDLWHEKQPVHNQTSAKYDWSLNDPTVCKPGTRFQEVRDYIEQYFADLGIIAKQISPVIQVNMIQDLEKYATTAAHVDIERPVSISMLIHKGGDDIITKWYNVVQEQPVDYPHCYPAEELIGPVFETRIEPRQWHYFNAGLPHSIHNIESYRTMLAVQTDNSQEDLLNKLPVK